MSAVCVLGAAWLWAKTLQFFQNSEYAPNSPRMPSYRVGEIEADGTGIFVPALLLLALGLFLAKFSVNLWQSESIRRKNEGGCRKPPP